MSTGSLALTASDIYWYVRSPFALWCNHNADPELRDAADLEALHRMAQGREHEQRVYDDQYPDVEIVEYTSIDEAIAQTMRDMESGISELLQGVICNPELGLVGAPDVMTRIDGVKSRFGDFAYAVSDVKLARRLQPWHILPTAFYAWLLNQVQRAAVDYFTIIDMDQLPHQFSLSDYEDDVSDAIAQTRVIVTGTQPRPTYGTTPYPWSTYGNEIAVKAGDITLISGIKEAKSAALRDEGIETVADVVAVGPEVLKGIRGFGESTAHKVWTKAAALHLRKPVLRREIDVTIPPAGRELFLDIETVGPPFVMTPEPLVYMIGVVERVEGLESFHQFTMQSESGEEVMWNEFVTFLCKGDPDFVIVHWGAYERTHLGKLSGRHDGGKTFRATIEPALHDLSKSADCIAFPVPGNSLKDIATWMRFEWTRPYAEASAMLSSQAIVEWWNSGSTLDDIIEPVRVYNEDDCRATVIVKDWLSNPPAEEMTARAWALLAELA